MKDLVVKIGHHLYGTAKARGGHSTAFIILHSKGGDLPNDEIADALMAAAKARADTEGYRLRADAERLLQLIAVRAADEVRRIVAMTKPPHAGFGRTAELVITAVIDDAIERARTRGTGQSSTSVTYLKYLVPDDIHDAIGALYPIWPIG